MKQRSNRRSTRRMRSRRRSVKRTNRTARRMRSRRRSTRRTRRSRKTRQNTPRSRRTRRSRRRLLKGGMQPVIAQAVDPREAPQERIQMATVVPQERIQMATVVPESTPTLPVEGTVLPGGSTTFEQEMKKTSEVKKERAAKQAVDILMSPGELLTEYVLTKGEIRGRKRNTKMGKKIYNVLAYSAHLHKTNDHHASGQFMLLAIHYAHENRPKESRYGRYIFKAVMVFFFGGFALGYAGGKLAMKAIKKVLPKELGLDFSAGQSKAYFNDLKRLYLKEYEELCTLGATFKASEMQEDLKAVKSKLGVGSITRRGISS